MSDAQTLDDIVVDDTIETNYSDVVNYNPLGDNVEEKDYQKANLQGAGRLPDLEEPTFEPPTLEDIRPEMFGGDTGEDEDEIFGRERLNDMPKGDKKKAAQQMTEMILEGYSSICSFGGNLASMKEGKLMEMQAEGKIDLRMPIPVSPTERVGVLDFVQSYNAQIDEAMEVSDEFKEAVRPPMTRILEKKGVGMTDEQFLLVMFGKDIITKSATTIALKRQLTRTLELVYDQYQNSGQPMPPPPPPVTPPPAPQPTQQQSAEESASESRRERRAKGRKKGNKAKIVAPND